MSWSTYGHNVKPGSPGKDILPDPPGDQSTEALEQVEVARKVAQIILGSGAVGDDSRLYNVNASGHANPGHAPQGGWSNDCISVSVSQATESKS